MQVCLGRSHPRSKACLDAKYNLAFRYSRFLTVGVATLKALGGLFGRQLQGTIITPSGRLPSERVRPDGYSLEGTFADDRARCTMSLTEEWR